MTDPIDGVQKYEKGEVNYTTNYLRIGEIPKYDTFYEYRMKVINDLVKNLIKNLSQTDL